ncbi:MAG TPA: DUF3945 domain-containing protein, partial [Chitinophagaceae bacterium]|nr:DUF3945 domain-containing protein [Chitinophagaceae bacterium]
MRFKHDEVSGESLSKFGLTLEKLKESGNYNRLLNGERTNVVSTHFFDGATARFEQGKFFLQQKDNKLMLMYDGMKASAAVPTQYKGYVFMKEEKEALNKLKHLGRTVQMVDANGEMKPYFVSIDKETNTMLRWEVSKFKAPTTLLGANVSKDQQAMLKEGKPVFI